MKKACVLFFAFLSTGSFAHAQVLQSQNSSRYIKAGGFHVYYERHGQGKPLLFLHAGWMDHRMWDKQVSYFEKNYEVVTIDMPGHSLTKGSDTTIEIQDVLRIVLDSLHIKKASVIGISFGSVCATDLAYAYPERVEKLLLVSPGINGWPEEMKLDSVSIKALTLRDSITATKDHKLMADYFATMWYDGPFRNKTQVNQEQRHYIETMALANNPNDRPHWPVVFDKKESGKHLNEIRLPVLIITADKDVPFILTLAEYIHVRIEGSKLIGFTNAAHMVTMEKPAEFNEAVAAFLKQ